MPRLHSPRPSQQVVACEINTGTGQVLALVTLHAGSTSGSVDLGRPASIRGNTSFEASSSNKFYLLVTNQILYKFGPGRYPAIRIYTENNSGGSLYVGASCVIVGELKDS